jgi:hypothetical protein
MTPEWKDAFLFTTKLADQLGLLRTGTTVPEIVAKPVFSPARLS